MSAAWDALLARPGLDFGIPTDHGAALKDFYSSTLPCEFLSEDTIVEGQDEVFYQLHRSWLKINTTAWALEPAVTGYSELIVADASVTEPVTTRDPDGLLVTRVPPGHDGVDEVGVVVHSENPDRMRQFLEEGMGAQHSDAGQVVGNTLYRVEPAPAPLGQRSAILTRGFTMVTLIVDDLLNTHQRLIDAGGRHGLRAAIDPAQPERCIFSFVADPDGNWIELVQFGELSGPLPTLDGEPLTLEEFFGFRDHAVAA